MPPNPLARDLLPLLALALAGCGTPAPPRLAAPPRDGTLAEVELLTGCWRGEQAEGVVEETWTRPSAGSMLGTGRTLVKGHTTFFEFLRIERRGAATVYVAQPRGGAPTEFRLTTAGEGHVVFTNPEHDFPRSIRYERRSATALHVHLEGIEAGAPHAEDLDLARVDCF